jgi:N-acetyl-gamma-glutamyl-phosphate reductase
MPPLKVAICGASGYTGAELLRLLLRHPSVRITAVTSEQSAGKTPGDLYGHLRGIEGLVFEHLEPQTLAAQADVFFLALPHGASQNAVNHFHRKGKRVIDLSADFRLKDPQVYEAWYKTPHRFRTALKASVYGLPELYRRRLKKASLVAVPGCYPTSAILALYPALKHGLVDTRSIVIDSKSGTSGAGRKAETAYFFCEVAENFRAYAVGSHRHTPEMEQELSNIAGGKIAVTFTPHLLPIDRGILSTIYVKVKVGIDMSVIRKAYEKTYRREPFVRVLPQGALPSVKDVRGTNVCAMGLSASGRTLVLVSTIDNLVKGASGQAVQCMNIMHGFPETTGLDTTAVYP